MKKQLSVFLNAIALIFLLQFHHVQAAPGDLDVGFAPPFPPALSVMAVQPDGRIIAAELTNRFFVALRLNHDGSIDSTFNLAVRYFSTPSFVALPDGKLLIAGEFTDINNVARRDLALLNPDGSLDNTFDLRFDPLVERHGDRGSIRGVKPLNDGRLLVWGSFTNINGHYARGIARLNADNSVDPTYRAETETDIFGVTSAQADSTVIISRLFRVVEGGQLVFHNVLSRLNSDGSMDRTFVIDPGTNGISSVTVQPDGHLFLIGGFLSINGAPAANFARLNPDGNVDNTFTTKANGRVVTLALQADGKILIGGEFDSVNGAARPHIARLHADGGVDLTFDPHAGPDASVSQIVLAPDGKVIIRGGFLTVNGLRRPFLARLMGGDFTGFEKPTIILQPESHTLLSGESVIFFAAANGSSPLAFQWYKNAVALPGETNTSLSLSSAHKTDEGVYTVVVSNPAGSTPSANAFLEVNLPDPRVTIAKLLESIGADTEQSFRVTLSAALASLERGNGTAAFNQLRAFQTKVQAQIGRSDPSYAETLIDIAQDALDAIEGGHR